MGTKALDKMTKAELIEFANQLQTTRIEDGRRICTLEGRVNDLSDQLTSLERRRLNEGNGYRRIIAGQDKTIAHAQGKRTPPSQDDSIADDDLTPAQRVLREHRRQTASA